ncbi:hypothetical protein sr10056 [Sporisorium reilianum SRZ2]|uniref:Tc1-like transposase DDE domain-containing protein n=1 Tax=Sporisorium reilianum (strain SRZ2) TaxID=999809 RepID=E6ZS70_SPORE|nr:hypothetical protein sr10056 [Sporisorium reilianum SRZ2]
MVPRTTAFSFFKHYRETGQAQAKKQGGNRQPVLTQEHLDWIQSQLDKRADTRVADLHNDIQKVFTFATPPSCSAINNTINNKLRYTLKLLHVEPANYNSPGRILTRQRWAESFIDSGANMFDCVFIDESPFNLHQHVSYGRAKRGERAIKTVASDRGQNILYMAAIGQEGIIVQWVHEGGTTGKLFTWFLKAHVFPKLAFGRRIIMDNCQIQKTKDVQDAFADSPHQAVFLPPYSPFLDAAEWLFAHVKPRLSKEQYKDSVSLFQAIRNSPSTVTPAMAHGWIREVNRNLHQALEGKMLGREYHWRMAEGDKDIAEQLLENLQNMQAFNVGRQNDCQTT